MPLTSSTEPSMPVSVADQDTTCLGPIRLGNTVIMTATSRRSDEDARTPQIEEELSALRAALEEAVAGEMPRALLWRVRIWS